MRDMLLPRLIVAFLAWATLLAGLTLPSFAPEISNVTILALMAAGLLHLFWVPERMHLLRQPASWMPLLAALLLLVAFSITAKSPLHVAAFLTLIHLYMVVPMSGLLIRLGGALTLDRIGFFALAGAAGGFAVAAIDVYVFGSSRGGLVNNPIHLADITLALGFVALVGLWSGSRWRLVFLAGPALSVGTVLLTASRGPMVAASLMLLTAALAMCFSWLPAYRRMRVIGGCLLVCIIMAALLVLTDAPDVPAIERIMALLHGGIAGDTSASERLIMYRSAFNAFLASPLVGHGLIDYPMAAAAYAPAGSEFPIYDHLHNDIADFGVAGGILGLAAYGLFLWAPIAGARRVEGALRMPLLYLGSVTTIGYFSMGMTNAVIGLRWPDIVLATVLALIVTLSNRPQGAQA